MPTQEQAEEIIKELDLLDSLSMFGEAHLVGNAALGTTVKPDVDYQIYATDEFDVIAKGVKELLEGRGLDDIQIRDLKTTNKFLVTGKVDRFNTVWSVDISIARKEDNTYIDDAYIFFMHFSPKFTPEKRKIIVKLKQAFYKKNMLWNGMSYYIYRAVLDNNAKTVKDIFDYLSENKINISRFKRGK
jgi:hypothetical protein